MEAGRRMVTSTVMTGRVLWKQHITSSHITSHHTTREIIGLQELNSLLELNQTAVLDFTHLSRTTLSVMKAPIVISVIKNKEGNTIGVKGQTGHLHIDGVGYTNMP